MPNRLKALLLPVAVTSIIAIGVACTASVFAQTTPTQSVPLTNTSTDTQATREYQNTRLHFSLDYPADLSVYEDIGPGPDLIGETISFINATTGKEFEITAFPFSQVDISANDFTQHEDYGYADQGETLSDVNFNGSLSTDPAMPEFSFVKNGIMYQVDTSQGDEAWLADILKTWQFN